MALKQKLQGFMPKIPDIGQVTQMLDERFAQLMGKLEEIRVILAEINSKTPAD